MLNADYIKRDLLRIATLLQIGITRIPREHMSEDDAIMRTAHNDILRLRGSIENQLEKTETISSDDREVVA